eukprot:NODE_3049_length_838_cov_182.026820.p1 GENE.NODE_3049_length_838_cov_182.026820~~NODE_3049_length_838_cov_182.026820.p1  ORF type:complete len:205 (-),score=73.53 NODE_3049_length_838_cov_182.026820:223-759(-)
MFQVKAEQRHVLLRIEEISDRRRIVDVADSSMAALSAEAENRLQETERRLQELESTLPVALDTSGVVGMVGDVAQRLDDVVDDVSQRLRDLDMSVTLLVEQLSRHRQTTEGLEDTAATSKDFGDVLQRLDDLDIAVALLNTRQTEDVGMDVQSAYVEAVGVNFALLTREVEARIRTMT